MAFEGFPQRGPLSRFYKVSIRNEGLRGFHHQNRMLKHTLYA